MDKKLLGCIVVAVLVLYTSVWVLWPVVSARMHTLEAASPQEHQPKLPADDPASREYVLEVIGLGVTLDKYRQGKLWDALQQGSPYTTIRETDPNKYPWTDTDKSGVGGGRALDALENAALHTPMYWCVPSFYAGSPIYRATTDPDWYDFIPGLVAGAASTGMAWHLFAIAPWRLAERPDRLIEDVFAFFDTYPDVPYVIVASEDSLGTRDSDSPPGTPRLLKDGYYVTERPDASALFILARRERVDPLRSFAWGDPKNDFLQNHLRQMYYDLMGAVPFPGRHPGNLRKPSDVGAHSLETDIQDATLRQPTVPEWLEAAAAFARRPEVLGTGLRGALSLSAHPTYGWKPTPWFPIPWTHEQLKTFDALPTLGYLHRPVFVKFDDEHGQPITRRDARIRTLLQGWHQALETLPADQRKNAPSRIIAATDDNTEQLILLHRVLDQQAEDGGPELDPNQSSQFIVTDRRLGNTGAATWFVQMAIGVMGSYRDGGVSAAINLRDPREASIVFISPPPEDKRRTQAHPDGSDVFGNHSTPTIDPDNYLN